MREDPNPGKSDYHGETFERAQGDVQVDARAARAPRAVRCALLVPPAAADALPSRTCIHVFHWAVLGWAQQGSDFPMRAQQ